MRPPPTIVGTTLDAGWFRRPLRRRLTFLALALVCGVLSLWPRHYVAKAELAPQDSGVGLNSILGAGAAGGLVSLGALVGNHSTVETDLTIARSNAVLKGVVAKLRLAGRDGFGDEQQAEVKLSHVVNIEALRGSILEITATESRPDFAKEIVSAYTAAIRDRLAAIALEQAALKRSVTNSRLAATGAQLAQAQAELTGFRLRHKLAAPEIELGAAVSNLANLQARLQARQAELQVVQRFATGDNIQLTAIRAEISSLQNQIAGAQAPNAGPAGGPNLGIMGQVATEYGNLYREARSDEILYDIYQRYLESVTVDELSAYASLDIIEPAYVDPARQYNLIAVGLFVLVIVSAFASEFYIVAPPVGRPPAERIYSS